MNIETLTSTKLTQEELGKLFGVGRITVISWMKGRYSPHRLHKETVLDVYSRLESAVKAGKLPLPTGLGKPLRLEAARRAIGLTD